MIYPNSELSAGALIVMSLVTSGALAFWLFMVYYVARSPAKHRGNQTNK
jgi:hypothetical protein